MRLHFYTVNDVYGNYAMQKTQQVMQRTGMNFEQLSEAFHYKGEKISKFLLFIIIPFMALFSWLVGYQKRKYYYDHFIFSTEAASFFLLLGFLIFPVLLLSLRALTGSLLINNDSYIAGIILFALLAYLVVGARKFFNFRWWYSLVYALLFTGVLAVFVNYVYKLILFFIAISQI
ncbi:MAG: hypothetical protein EOO03_04195 [Chitinophagaceae bacterium]|nr:MAG: hypothetical protein EOO03_04195 [Chitinophagaceae bacterium]